jgi:hypothetical protein
MTIDERISSELRRHAPQVDEHAAWERFQSAAPSPARGRAMRLVPVAAALGVFLLGVALVQNLPSAPGPASPLQSPFRGTWLTNDPDGSTPTMTVEVSGDGVVEIVVLDDLASVCSGAPSTMTGTGRLESDTVLVIPTPVLTCDDGTEPQALSGGPLEEMLRDLTFTHDPESDTLTDNIGAAWHREGAEDPSPEPTTPTPELPNPAGMWPQTSQEELEQAQELADAGDPDVTWQLDPDIADGNNPNAEIIARFIHEGLGWEQFLFNEYVGWDQATSNLTYVRCAPGGTNPLYPEDDAGRCAPTIDELTYETVSIDLVQPGQSGPSGIWVVSDWTMGTFSQVAPPTAEAAARVEDFLQARIEGEGAEKFLEGDGDIPLLYATTAGARYERFEYERVGGPRWPFGSMEFRVRLFAGDTVVEQFFSTPWDGGLGLQNHAIGDVAATTENGQPLAVPYDIFEDGLVTLHAPHPWRIPWMNYWGLMVDQGTSHDRIHLLADPLPVGVGCEAGPPAADAEALAGIIRSDPDLETTEPVAVSLGGAEALTMDVVAATGASFCDYFPAPLVVSSATEQLPASMDLAPGNRMRLYMLDLPEGLPARLLAIAVIAPEERFDAVLEAAEPILESIEFDTG